MLSLKLIPDSGRYSYSPDLLKQWKFPCGESGIKLSEDALQKLNLGWKPVLILDFEGDGDLFALAQAVDAIRQEFVEHIGLTMKYVHYGRQDRRCFSGEGHALKVFAGFINSLKFSSVVVADAHSSVTHALFDNLQEIPQETCAYELPKFDVLIAPDAGAEKKVFKHKQVAEGTEVICASKTRDSQGKITSVYLPFGGKVKGKKVCIVDDLCDGGATFLELGKVVKEYEPAEMCLYVTHGMFTNPAKFVELNDMFDRIFVYNLSPSAAKYAGYVETI